MFSYACKLPLKGETRHEFINRQMTVRRDLKKAAYRKTSFIKRLFGHIESDLNDYEIRAIYNEAYIYQTKGLLS